MLQGQSAFFETRSRLRAFTVIELMLVIGLVAILTALLFSTGQNARGRSNSMQCIANLRMISVASLSYSSDNQGKWPPNEVNASTGNKVFLRELLPYLDGVPVRPDANFRKSPFICPGERSSEPDGQYIYKGVYLVASRGLSYGQNGYLHATATNTRVGLRSAVQNPAQLVLYMDFQGHYVMDISRLGQGDRKARILERHGELANAAFADGSVRQVELDKIPTTTPSLFWQGRGL